MKYWRFKYCLRFIFFEAPDGRQDLLCREQACAPKNLPFICFHKIFQEINFETDWTNVLWNLPSICFHKIFFEIIETRLNKCPVDILFNTNTLTFPWFLTNEVIAGYHQYVFIRCQEIYFWNKIEQMFNLQSNLVFNLQWSPCWFDPTYTAHH